MGTKADYILRDFDAKMNPRIIEWANPNRHGIIALIELTCGYCLYIEDVDGYEPQVIDYDIDSYGPAYGEYLDAVNERSNLPNWELQAEYDEMWGPPLDDPWRC